MIEPTWDHLPKHRGFVYAAQDFNTPRDAYNAGREHLLQTVDQFGEKKWDQLESLFSNERAVPEFEMTRGTLEERVARLESFVWELADNPWVSGIIRKIARDHR